MPEAVKISELPVMSTVQPGDIVPVVDEQLTQTGRATAAQIAAIGGGPPGDNTVSAAKIQNGAVTVSKLAFSAPDRLFSRTATGAGPAIEIACTPYARGLLEISNASAARAYLDGLQSNENPTFTGTVTISGGLTVSGAVTMTGGQVRAIAGATSAPGYSFASDTNTGIANTAADTLNFVTGGVERLRIDSNGGLSSPITAGGALFSQFAVRAWAQWWVNGISASGNISSIQLGTTGVYNILFSQQMPDASYAPIAMGISQNGNVAVLWSWLVGAGQLPQIGFRLEFVNAAGTYQTPSAFAFAVLR